MRKARNITTCRARSHQSQGWGDGRRLHLLGMSVLPHVAVEVVALPKLAARCKADQLFAGHTSQWWQGASRAQRSRNPYTVVTKQAMIRFAPDLAGGAEVPRAADPRPTCA